MKYIVLSLIKFYQKFISPIKPKSCRYYPTCSQYASWCFEKSSFFSALLSSFLRILRCNPFFVGGIEYPCVNKKFHKYSFILKKNFTHDTSLKIKFWFIPKAKNSFYLIKTLNFKDN